MERWKFVWSVLGGLVAVALFGLAWGQVSADLARPRDLHRSAYVGSAGCSRCHGDHTASWSRTFHRTMTQAASERSVQGDFADTTLDYFGVQARMERAQDGGFRIRYASSTLGEHSFRVEKTVGSRRYQQYVARVGGALMRLPVAWHIEEQRWFHMNGAFLTPDPGLGEGPLTRADYERHVTRWNDNCVFCHNVAPNPGKHVGSTDTQVTFATTVAELGVACEACHGPGEEHTRVNANPLRRQRLHLRGGRDPTIVNPARLAPERSADICGRCHGQRITDDVERFMTRGDGFVPGEDLALYSAPLWRDTLLHGEPGAFAARFWADGTPRLTAYEYQGMLQSACSARGTLTCTDCHGMHEGDPRGQIRPNKQGAALCTDCHRELRTPAAQQAHARHDAAQARDCVSCHMPSIVYGVLAAHPSHRIERPDPALAAQAERPDACTNCHVDRSRRWAATEFARMWSPSPAPLPSETPWPEIETQLFAGDPIARVLSAHALAQPSADLAARTHRLSLLLEVMAHDPYPAVRHFAWRAARALAPQAEAQLRAYVPESPQATRAPRVDALARALHTRVVDRATLTSLRARAADQAIEIGE